MAARYHEPTIQLLPRGFIDVQRFAETIEGRTYHIEVARVARDRWRAHLVRVPGVPTAMMPFYGPTPDAAAQLLTEWLTRAHRTVRGPSVPEA
jgi:hypothetical protein